MSCSERSTRGRRSCDVRMTLVSSRTVAARSVMVVDVRISDSTIRRDSSSRTLSRRALSPSWVTSMRALSPFAALSEGVRGHEALAAHAGCARDQVPNAMKRIAYRCKVLRERLKQRQGAEA